VADFIIQATHSIVEAGEPILFDGTSSFDTKSDKTNLTFLWDFNDGNTSNLPIVNYTFKNSGTYLVTLTVTDDNDISHSKQTAITIIPSDVEIDDKPKTESEGDSFFMLIMIFLIIIIIILVVAFWTVKKRRAQKLKGEEEPVATVEATVLDAPEFATTKGAIVGRTRKPTEKLIKPSKTIETIPRPEPAVDRGLPPVELETTALPPAAPEEPISPEAEIEFVPKVSLPEPEVEGIGPTDEISEPLPEEITTTTPEVDLDIEVELPPEAEGVPDITTPEIPIPEVTEAEVELPESEELDFVPPKIDLTGIVPPPVQPTQPHRQEIVEAHKRGEGISFDFKKPGKKKEK
jgi:PKD repeat protein